MFSQSTIAIFSATRLIFDRRRTLVVMFAAYAGLLAAGYLFVSTREATIWQLILTMAVVVVAPVLFFILQSICVNYANKTGSRAMIRKVSTDVLKLIVVTLPLIVLTAVAIQGLNKIVTHPTIVITLRYLLIGVVIPLLAIQLWIATSNVGIRSLLRGLRRVAVRTFAPQSVFIYACGFLIFAVVPYFLIVKTIPTERAWLELSLLVLRLSLSALLILLGWITTVSAISILNRDTYAAIKGK